MGRTNHMAQIISQRMMAEVIKALADNDMNVSKTANAMHYHRNNIIYHVEKIKDETGLNPLKFYDLIKLLKMVGEKIC